MEKKVESASVATALAKYDFPVPGGCVCVRGEGRGGGRRIMSYVPIKVMTITKQSLHNNDKSVTLAQPWGRVNGHLTQERRDRSSHLVR